MLEENSTDDVIVEENQEQENEQTTDDVSGQEDDTSSAAPQEKTEQVALDRPQYNIDAEVERKVANKIEELIPKLTEAVTPKQQQYSIEQLEQFKAQNSDEPNNVAWANAEIRKLEKAELLSSFQQQQEQLTQKQQAVVQKQQAELQVVNDPSYEEAFISTPTGKSWNPNSKLAQLAGQLHNDPSLKNRPDGIAIAMEVAYGRLAKSGELKTNTKLTSIKRENQKLKKMTLAEGGGANKQVTSKSNYSKAFDRLSRSGKDSDAVAAFNAMRNKG